MPDTISVIIPVYNVEQYLPACLDSLLSQSYRELEILLIDDGSTDSSGAICDEYAKKDYRIRVIHQKNGGAANAKNTGLRAATGKYLTFLDSDDYLEPDAYKYMLNRMKETGADVVQCAFRLVYVDESQDVVMAKEPAVYGTQDYLLQYTKDWTCGLLWDKLYCRSLFDGIFFEEGHKIDDEFFTYQGMMNAQKVLRDPKIIYNYRQRGSSVVHIPAAQAKRLMDKLDYLPQRRVKIAARFPELKQDFDYHYLNMLLIIARDEGATAEVIRRVKRMIGAYFKEGKSCKMELSLRLQLRMLQWSSPKKLVKQKAASPKPDDGHNYFA